MRLLGQLVKGGEVGLGCRGQNSRETVGTACQRWRSESGECWKRTHVKPLGQLVKSGEVGQEGGGGVGQELT